MLFDLIKNENILLKYSFGFYIILILLLLVYQFNYGTSYNISIYFYIIPLILLSILIIYQIEHIPLNKNYFFIILFEIILMQFILHLFFATTVPYGIFGRDGYNNILATRQIIKYGWPIKNLNIAQISEVTIDWPLMNILSIVSSKILGIKLFSITNIFSVAKILPILTGIFSSLAIFLLSKILFKNIKISLLTTFAASMIFGHIYFHSWYANELISYPLFFYTIYSYFRNITSHEKIYSNKFIFLLFLFALFLSHDLTSFIFMLLMILLSITTILFSYFNKIDFISGENKLINYKSTHFYVILTIIVFISYLMYIGQPIFEVIIITSNALFNPIIEITSDLTVEKSFFNILKLILRYFFILLFVIFIYLKVRKDRKINMFDMVSIFWTGSIFFIIALRSLFKLPFDLGVMRLENFIWPFLLISSAGYIIRNKSKYFLSFFVVFNLVILMPAYVYDFNNEPSYEENSVRMRYYLSEFRAVEWFNGDGIAVGDLTTKELLGGLKGINVVSDEATIKQIYNGVFINIYPYDYIVIRAEFFDLVKVSGKQYSLFKLSNDSYSLFQQNNKLLKVYDNNNFEYYKINADGER